MIFQVSTLLQNISKYIFLLRFCGIIYDTEMIFPLFWRWGITGPNSQQHYFYQHWACLLRSSTHFIFKFHFPTPFFSPLITDSFHSWPESFISYLVLKLNTQLTIMPTIALKQCNRSKMLTNIFSSGLKLSRAQLKIQIDILPERFL